MALKLKAAGMRLVRIKQLFHLSPSSLYYRPRKKQDYALVDKIKEIAFKYPSYGYRRIWAVLAREGFQLNIKKVYRLYRGGGSAAPAKQEAEDKNLFCGIYSQGHLSPQCMDDGFFLHQIERRKEGEGVGCHG